MADTIVETLVLGSLDSSNGLFGPYWSTPLIGVIIFIDDSSNISFARTTNGGASWSTTEIQVGDTTHLSCYYDKETPSDTGTLIHATWADLTGTDSIKYVTIDVSDGSVGTIRILDNTVTVSTSTLMRLAVTKTVSGNIIVAFSTQTEIGCLKSADNFATAGTVIADPFETATEEDFLLLYPAATADDSDACSIFWDRSANELSVKMYDDSENTWTETSISGSMAADPQHYNMDAAVRHSDSHILFVAHSNDDNAGDDLRTWDLTVDSIATPTVTAKTNIFTNQAESAQTCIVINQQTGDVYVAHLKGGAWLTAVDIVYHLSGDGMATWGSETAYSEDTADDFRLVHGGRTIGDDGGRIQFTFFNSDLAEIFVNLTNDIEITAVGVGGIEIFRRRIEGC